MHELWKKIEYPSVPKDVKHYEVSNLGNIRRGSIMEKVTMEQNGDVTVVLLSLNGDYVGPDSTPPRKYVVIDLLRDAFDKELRMVAAGDTQEMFDPSWRIRTHDRCRPRFGHRVFNRFELDGPVIIMDGLAPDYKNFPTEEQT